MFPLTNEQGILTHHVGKNLEGQTRNEKITSSKLNVLILKGEKCFRD